MAAAACSVTASPSRTCRSRSPASVASQAHSVAALTHGDVERPAWRPSGAHATRKALGSDGTVARRWCRCDRTSDRPSRGARATSITRCICRRRRPRGFRARRDQPGSPRTARRDAAQPAPADELDEACPRLVVTHANQTATTSSFPGWSKTPRRPPQTHCRIYPVTPSRSRHSA